MQNNSAVALFFLFAILSLHPPCADAGRIKKIPHRSKKYANKVASIRALEQANQELEGDLNKEKGMVWEVKAEAGKALHAEKVEAARAIEAEKAVASKAVDAERLDAARILMAEKQQGAEALEAEKAELAKALEELKAVALRVEKAEKADSELKVETVQKAAATTATRVIKSVPDPTCGTGIVSLATGHSEDAQVCCPNYCGECGDYPTCSSVRGMDSGDSCCVSQVRKLECGEGASADVCIKSCSKSSPPCIMEQREAGWWKPKNADMRHAKDDCGEAVEDWRTKATSAIAAAEEEEEESADDEDEANANDAAADEDEDGGDDECADMAGDWSNNFGDDVTAIEQKECEVTAVNPAQGWSPASGSVDGSTTFNMFGMEATVSDDGDTIVFPNGGEWYRRTGGEDPECAELAGDWSNNFGDDITTITQEGCSVTATNPLQGWSPAPGSSSGSTKLNMFGMDATVSDDGNTIVFPNGGEWYREAGGAETPGNADVGTEADTCNEGPGGTGEGIDKFTQPKCGRSPGTTIDKLEGIKTLAACQRKCLNKKGCKAVIYRKGKKTCFRLARKYNKEYETTKSGDSVVSNKKP